MVPNFCASAQWMNDERGFPGLRLAEIRATEAALQLLKGMQDLLSEGRYWRPQAAAATWQGSPCHPLGSSAYYFDLDGAATRVRWGMRRQLQAAHIDRGHLEQTTKTLLSFANDYRCGPGGWSFACSLLDGLQEALAQYRSLQLTDLDEVPLARYQLRVKTSPIHLTSAPDPGSTPPSRPIQES